MEKPLPSPGPQSAAAIAAVAEALGTMRYGTILLTVHDSRVVQLEVTEKRRFGH